MTEVPCLRIYMKYFGVFLFFIGFCWAQPPRISKTITVGYYGTGQFKSVQEAINSVPLNNREWVHIFVKQGTYMETVRVDRQYIFLEGEGSQRTVIGFANYGTPQGCETIEFAADNVVAKNIGFKNNHDLPGNSPPGADNANRIQAVAATVSGDKVAFYNCAFMGVQDTLWDRAGRHYFHSCYILGCVDFIFGAGQSHYENCVIHYNGAAQLVNEGYITAQGRNTSDETNGFVFLNCTMEGSGKTYLGRAWRPYARVLFYKSQLSEIVVPKGWDAWHSTGHEENLVFGERGCYGPGSDTSQRVPWEKKLSNNELNRLTSRSYIDTEGWIERQP